MATQGVVLCQQIIIRNSNHLNYYCALAIFMGPQLEIARSRNCIIDFYRDYDRTQCFIAAIF